MKAPLLLLFAMALTAGVSAGEEEFRTVVIGKAGGFVGVGEGLTVNPLVKEIEPIEIFGDRFRAYDLQDWVASLGVETPPGSAALLLKDSGTMILRNTKKNLDLFQSCFDLDYTVGAKAISLRFQLVSFRLPPSQRDRNLSYKELHIAAGDSWRVLDTIIVMAEPGLPIMAKSARSRLSSGGANVVEAVCLPVIDSDGETMQVDFRCRFTGKTAEGQPYDISEKGSLTTKNEGTVVRPSIKGKEGIYYAIVLHNVFMTPGAMPGKPVQKEEVKK